MSPRLATLTSLLFLAAGACSTESDDSHGTYRLALSRRTLDQAPAAPLPSTVTWPRTTDLTLRFDEAGQAQVTLLDGAAVVAVQKIVTNGRLGYSPPAEDGSLELGINPSSTLLVVDDLAACPRAGSAFGGPYFELFFLDGHVRGSTGDAIVCNVPPETPSEIFVFDITGDRISD